MSATLSADGIPGAAVEYRFWYKGGWAPFLRLSSVPKWTFYNLTCCPVNKIWFSSLWLWQSRDFIGFEINMRPISLHLLVFLAVAAASGESLRLVRPMFFGGRYPKNNGLCLLFVTVQMFDTILFVSPLVIEHFIVSGKNNVYFY